MFDNNNLYVLNKKDRNALVYRDSMGTISRLTRDMFSSDEEFEYWKKWSDEDYHNEEKERHVFADNTLYIDGMSEEAATEDSPEDLFFMSLSSLERTELCSILMEKFPLGTVWQYLLGSFCVQIDDNFPQTKGSCSGSIVLFRRRACLPQSRKV